MMLHPISIDKQRGHCYVVNVSGGRTSAYMLRCILSHNGGVLPEGVCAVFANTGKEREETLDFVYRMEKEWGVDIGWVEYDYHPWARGVSGKPRHTWKGVDHYTASRRGEPFATLMRVKKMVPNVTQRICTHHLKVRAIEGYVSHRYGCRRGDIVHVLGIRKDEPGRATRILDECQRLIPLWHAGVTREVVNAYWESSTFDLQLSYEHRYGNCDLCFLKGERDRVRLIAEEPERVDWWINQERLIGNTFRSNKSYQELQAMSTHYSEQMDLDLELDVLDGFGNEQIHDCYCG